MPDEEEQYAAYREVAERMAPRPVIIRTMDLGGDKVASYLGADVHLKETNPFLGWRGIRFSLEHRAAFRTQLRAIYRAAHHGNVKLMLPMITSVEELRASRALAADVSLELDRDETPRGERVELGIMVETPVGGLPRRRLRPRSGLLLGGLERPDPVHDGRRPLEPEDGGALPALASRDPARSPECG